MSLDPSALAAVPRASRREILAWAMYDWANSAYSTLSITVLVTYLQKLVLPGNGGVLVWGWGIGLTMLCSAVLAPITGAMADAHATKHRWLCATALLGACATLLMFFATPDRWLMFVVLFLVANLFFELSFGFYNAFLPDLADVDEMDRVSSLGYGLGYIGGGLALVVVLMVISKGELIGLPSIDNDPTGLLPRIGLATTGLWWLVFSLPMVLVLRDKQQARSQPMSMARAAREAIGEVGRTLRHVRQYKMLALFLIGFLFFNDGVQTVISQASVFAGKVLEMDTSELIQVILMIQFVAFPGAMLVGWLAGRLGQKPTLLLCLGVWIVLLAGSLWVTERWHFWILAFFTALVLGGIQSVSRAIMGRMTPPSRAAEFFGFFNLTGKATSPFGPILFSSIFAATGSAHLALVSLLAFFLLGGAFVLAVDVHKGEAIAKADVA